MSGFQTNLLTGMAAYLAAGGIGATWKPSGAYTALELAIVLYTMPEAPDRVITLSAYSDTDSPALSDSSIGLQVRCRWDGQDPRPVDDLQDAIFNLLHGKTQLALQTGVNIQQCLRRNAIVLGQDQNARWENVANYVLSVHRPSTHRT